MSALGGKADSAWFWREVRLLVTTKCHKRSTTVPERPPHWRSLFLCWLLRCVVDRVPGSGVTAAWRSVVITGEAGLDQAVATAGSLMIG